MKKLIGLILCSVIVFSFSSCNNSEVAQNDASSKSNAASSDSSIEGTTSAEITDTTKPQDNELINSKYNELINNLKTVITKRLDPTFENQYTNDEFNSPNPDLSYNWQNMLIDAPIGIDEPKMSSFGYAIHDINNDGIDELLFLREDSFLLAIFTLDNDEPFLADAFWYRYKGMILENGDVFTHGSSGASNYEYSVRQLNKKSTEFTSLLSFGEDGDGIYYKEVGGEKENISEDEFDALMSEYPYDVLSQGEDFMAENNITFIPFEN